MPDHLYDETEKLEERSERMRAALREQPGFLEMIRRSQQVEREGKVLTLEEIKAQFEIAD